MTVLVNAPVAAAFLTDPETGVRVTEGQIRQWASRGHVHRHGKDRDGRTLYDLVELRARATRPRGGS